MCNNKKQRHPQGMELPDKWEHERQMGYTPLIIAAIIIPVIGALLTILGLLLGLE